MPKKKQGTGEGIGKIIQDPRFAGKFIMKDMLPIKMSAVLLDFAKPLLDKIDLSNKSVTEKTIQLAVEIWNYSIVIDSACVKAGAAENRLYWLAIAGTVKKKLAKHINKTDYYGLLERKKVLYPDNKFFIIEHNLRWSDNDGQMHLAVVTGDASNIQLTERYMDTDE